MKLKSVAEVVSTIVDTALYVSCIRSNRNSIVVYTLCMYYYLIAFHIGSSGIIMLV